MVKTQNVDNDVSKDFRIETVMKIERSKLAKLYSILIQREIIRMILRTVLWLRKLIKQVKNKHSFRKNYIIKWVYLIFIPSYYSFIFVFQRLFKVFLIAQFYPSKTVNQVIESLFNFFKNFSPRTVLKIIITRS